MRGWLLEHGVARSPRGTHQTPLSSWGGLANPGWPSCRGRNDGRDSHALWFDPGDVLHALVAADQMSGWATHGDMLTWVWYIGLCWFASLLAHYDFYHVALVWFYTFLCSCLARQFSRPSCSASPGGAYVLHGSLCHVCSFIR